MRVAASAALIAIGERLADRLADADRRRRATRQEYAASSQHKGQDAAQSASEDRSVVPYAHPGELADRGYVGGVIETLIIIRRTIRSR